ncbi:MAG: family 1 glycosylhydrolase [Nitrospirae bacterium]|nr:family 1 glycosylhydrolase [Nitrospirota bacterium]
MKSFPEDFLWGVATSAFQLEGSPYADWTSWDSILSEKPEVTNYYNLYKEDLALLNELWVNAYRFSLEWSRIQPRENVWDERALSHYQEIINILVNNNIEPMVTLHHFTHPLWFIKKYPWHEDASVEYFSRYVEKVLTELKGVRYWITFNEPCVLLLGGYLEGCMPPGKRDASLAVEAVRNILACHGRAYEMIHGKASDAMVSVAVVFQINAAQTFNV